MIPLFAEQVDPAFGFAHIISSKVSGTEISGNGKGGISRGSHHYTELPFKGSASLRKTSFKAIGKLQQFPVQSTFGKGVFPIT